MDVFVSDEERAALARAESAFPSLRAQLEQVWDEPLRHLELSIDQATWPLRDGSALELVLEPESLVGSARLLLAPYVEGNTWSARFGFEERPAADFFARTKPRVDARFRSGETVLALTAHVDGSELGEEPLILALKLDGAELPSVRRLVAGGASVALFRHATTGEISRVDAETSELELCLAARFEHESVTSITLWRSRSDRSERVLCGAPSLAACRTPLERQPLLAAYYARPLRAAARSRTRRDRLAAALETGAEVAATDRFAAARLWGARGDRFALRRQSLLAADAFSRAASLLLRDFAFEFETAAYAEFFELWRYATRAMGVLAKTGHDDAFAHWAGASVRASREMARCHPEEPDYARALAHALVLRAEAIDARSGGLDDDALDEGVALFDELARREAWPWRANDAERMRARAGALYRRHHAME